MKVLVLESELGAASTAIAELEAAGHEVKRCHEPGARPFPCVGLDPGTCPLEAEAIDVAVTVRGKIDSRPSPYEDGITCALRRRIPVVVAGLTAINPFAPFDAVAASSADVVEACEQAATGARLEHEAVATAALDQTLRAAALPVSSARASVVSDGGALRVTLFVPPESTKGVRDMAVVRVAGALRAFDRNAAQIDIACEVLR
jgi:hypothetical protein